MPVSGASVLARADAFLLLLHLGAQRFAVTDELFLQLHVGLGVTLLGGFLELAFHEDFAVGDFGFVERVEVGELGFLRGGDLVRGRLLDRKSTRLNSSHQ